MAETEVAKACREHQRALESYVDLLTKHTATSIELEKARHLVNEKEDVLRIVRQDIISLKP